MRLGGNTPYYSIPTLHEYYFMSTILHEYIFYTGTSRVCMYCEEGQQMAMHINTITTKMSS